ncbi:MAG: hypothetical protein ACEQSB_03935 [Undibacterium sp.]
MGPENMQLPTEEWKKPRADFHLDPSKQVDAVEELVDKFGPQGAYDQVMEDLEKDPDNTEKRRQAALLANKFEELASTLRSKTSN